MAACAPATADNAVLAVTATVVSKGKCTFATGTVFNAALKNNGTDIDPSLSAPATATATGSFICVGNGNQPVTFVVAADDGSHRLASGPRRMRHESVITEYIPYSLSISPSSASVPKNESVTVVITATALASDFQNVIAGRYSDTVTVSVSP